MNERMKRLSLTDTFRFSCHKTVPCFNRCCADLNQFLTPYDILRLKNRLELSSSRFLEQYTCRHIGPQSGLPVITLKTGVDSGLICSFVTENGCGVYADRPSSCRMYPLARVVSRSRETGKVSEHYFLIEEDHCLGFGEESTCTVQEWINSQDVSIYNEMNDLLMELISLKNRRMPGPLDERTKRLLHMVLYDLDRFRSYIAENNISHPLYESSDLRRLDDVSLLKFSFDWVKRELFGELI